MRIVSKAAIVALCTCFAAATATAQTSRSRTTPSNARVQVAQVEVGTVRGSFRTGALCNHLACPGFVLIGVGF